MTAPARLGLFGVGLIGLRHIEIAAGEPTCTIVAAADPEPSARAATEAAGARYYGDYRELLERESLDGVIVATPNSTHVPVGLDCVRAGLPMLMEKPLADTVESGFELVRAARDAGVALAVGHHRRFDPTIERAVEMIRDGAIGKLVALHVIWSLRKHDTYFDVEWRTTRPGGGPALINLIHDLDLMRHFGGEMTRVYAELGSEVRGLEVEDVIAATMRFESGALASIVATDVAPSPWGWELGSGENPLIVPTGRNCFRLLGTEGSLSLPRLELWRHDDQQTGSWREPIHMHSEPFGPRTALARQLAHFCAVVRGEEEPRISGEDGLATLAAVEAVTRSGKSASAEVPQAVL